MWMLQGGFGKPWTKEHFKVHLIMSRDGVTILQAEAIKFRKVANAFKAFLWNEKTFVEVMKASWWATLKCSPCSTRPPSCMPRSRTLWGHNVLRDLHDANLCDVHSLYTVWKKFIEKSSGSLGWRGCSRKLSREGLRNIEFEQRWAVKVDEGRSDANG